MKKHLKIGIWISLFAVLSSLISFVATAYAANEGIERKWLANGVAVSLSSDSLHKTISYDDSMSNFLVADSVFDEGVGSIPVPSYGYFDGAEGTITYLEAYKGFSEKQSFNTGGAISYKGFKGYTTTWGNSDYTSDGVPSMLSETGYVATSGSNGNSIQIKGTSTVGGYEEEFAVTIVQEDGNVYLDYSNVPSSYKGIMSYEASEGGLFFRRGEDDYIGPLQLTGNIAADTRTIQTYINGLVVTFGGDSFTFETATSGAKTQFEFRGDPESVAKNLTGVDTLDLTKQERYDLYRYYLDKVAGSMGNSYCVYGSPDKAPDDMIKINLQNNGKWTTYYYYKNNFDFSSSFQTIKDGGGGFTTIGIEDVAEWLNSASEGEPQEECKSNATKDSPIAPTTDTPDESTGPSSGNDQYVEDTEVDCFNAAGSLGWILCPVIEFTQHTITAIYGSIVENFLEFRAEWLDIGGQGESVYQAWQTFQSFANIIFVIVLLVVIFSQLTGVGIDNLGIKRVLPKLIIAAILINLSYLICMLFVDISNILGVGFNNIFSNIIVSIDGDKGAGTGAQVLTTVVTGAVAGAVGFLALNPVTVGIFGSVIVIPLVLGLIGVLVGVLFFFILLGARQAGIIMLVVASPIAFACYMLPNTKTIFDKWLKMFEGLLLLFPICGLLMGGSAFASKVLLTVDTGFLGALIAMLVGVVPFFFIPTLLRGAFSAMGNLGARISGIGQNISRGLGRAAAGSDTMKDFQTRMRAGIDRNGNLTRAGEARMRIARGEGRLGKVSALRQRVGRAQLRSLAAYEKMQDEVDLASRPDLYRADAEAKRFGRRQAAADSELASSGVANRTGDVKDFVAGQSTFEEGTLAYAAIQAARDGDVEMQYATTERMLAQGHHGAEAYRQVLATLEAQGDTAALENFAKAAKESRNLGDLKSGARSTFDYVSAIADNKVTRSENGSLLSSVASGQSLNDYTNKVKYSNMSEAQVIGMDREELSRAAEIIRQKRQSGEAFTKEEESLISQANKAFRNDRLRGSAKESNQKLAAEIAGISEAEQRRIVGDRIDINRNSENGNDGNGESAAPNSTSNSGSNTSPTPNQTPSSSRASTQAPVSNSAPTPSPAPSRGNMNDEELRNLRGFYQRKVDNNTATPEDRNALNRINNELDLRETGYSRDEGTPV